MTTAEITYEPKRGDTVRWLTKYGLEAAPVVSYKDGVVRVFARWGRYVNLHIDELRGTVNDMRMQRLRELEAGGPDDRVSAHLKREAFVEKWIRDHRPQDNEDSSSRQRSQAKNHSYADEVLKVIENSEWPVSRSDILAEIQITPNEFTAAIKVLKDQKLIQANGVRKGTTYSMPNKVYDQERPKAEPKKRDNKNIDDSLVQKVLDFMEAGKPYSRAMLMEGCDISTPQWIEVAKALRDKVTVEGIKRGTRYIK